VAFRDHYQGRPTPAMGKLTGKREWETLYHGWEVPEVIKDLGFVRSDGKTMVSQPNIIFDDKYMWTLDHLKGIELKSPNVLLNQMTPEQREAHMAEYRQGGSGAATRNAVALRQAAGTSNGS
jgi:propane monooxygenase large subunit